MNRNDNLFAKIDDGSSFRDFLIQGLDDDLVTCIINILQEAYYGELKFGAYNTKHEAIAVIREEYLELESEIFHGKCEPNQYDEATQVAATSLRFMLQTKLNKW